jgi:2,4-dienoyl-CoA reductase-like NADH-dependent reductase (Old Yellow Enzyme family)
VHPLSVDEIKALHRRYADAAVRARDAGYQWLELHFAHGYLGASFFSPLANQRNDEYGGSVVNRARFLLEAIDAVRAVWPEQYPLTMRLGCDDLHPDGTQFEDSIVAIRMMKDHGPGPVDATDACALPARTLRARREPQPGWTPGEDSQRGSGRSRRQPEGNERPGAHGGVVLLARTSSPGCGVRLALHAGTFVRTGIRSVNRP